MAGGSSSRFAARTLLPCRLTLPSDLGPIAIHNPRSVYGLLMQAAAETLIELAADPKHLGAKIGVLMTLHTWGRKLESILTSIAS